MKMKHARFGTGGAGVAVVALLALASLCAVVPAGAAAKGRFVLEGHGYGHGVGLSQYGAYGYAKHGVGYKKILGHYYSGTKVGRTKSKRIGVLLSTQPGGVSFSHARRACGRDVKPSKTYRARLARGGAKIRLESGKGKKIASCGRKLGAIGGAKIEISGLGHYRGALVVKAAGGGSVNVINRLALDDYLKGVVPHEVPASWPADALRAQAVAARGFALTSGVDGDGYTLYADTRSQAYGGADSETKETNKAVKATRREVVTYRGEPAQTFYFSTSGGRTESSQYGFSGGSAVPYLKAVDDRYDGVSPYHSWKVTYSRSELAGRLGAWVKGRLQGIKVLKTGDSPRVVRARVVGSRGSTTVSGAEIQVRLGLRSTWFRLRG
jgi:stage II sporulation protein D